ncbi:MAG: type III secretion inner membrane ring lipoprotein SctJ [Chlamydiae bacterium]|nr:type III secretion inner membrane ring lipoprotein SctJ [Chlamydiota bacterium]
MLKKVHSLIAIFFLLILCGCVNNTTIANNIPEREANEIVVFLSSKGIPATREHIVSGGVGGTGPELWNVSVDASKAVEAMSLLNKNGLPRQQGQDLLSLFGEAGLVPTDMQQKIRYQAGLAQQIANTILKIDGVLDATVQISTPSDSLAEPVTAAVFVKHQGILDNPNSQLIIKIKQLVSGAVTGLRLENVTVITDRSLFTETPVESFAQEGGWAGEYVSIWGINITRDSLFLFRVIFFTLCMVVLLLIGIMSWIIWRLIPILDEKGGIAYLWQMDRAATLKPSETTASTQLGQEPLDPPVLPGK